MKYWVLLLTMSLGSGFVWFGAFWFFLKEKIKAIWYKWTNPSQHLRTFFIFPNNRMVEYNTLHDETNNFKYDGGKYFVHDKNIIYTGRWGNIATLIYEYGNPNPINFSDIKKVGQDGIVSLDALGYKEAMEQKFIKDLMTESKTFMFILIIVGLNIVLTLVMLAKQFGLFDKTG